MRQVQHNNSVLFEVKQDHDLSTFLHSYSLAHKQTIVGWHIIPWNKQ